jgi:hypothetical protein
MLFREYLFQPMRLLVSDPLIGGRGLVSDDELFTATVTPEGTHVLESRGLLSALPLLNCHCPHCCSHSIFDQPVQGFLTLESLTEGAIGSVFFGGPIGIPVKVRWSDAAAAFDEYEKAHEGFAFQIIPIDDEGTPDWVPDPRLHPSQEQVDQAVEGLLRDGDGTEGRP